MTCSNLFGRLPGKRRPAGQEIPQRGAERINVRSRVGGRLAGLAELFRTRESRGANEPDLRLLGRIGGRRENFSHAVVDNLDQERAT